MSTTVEQVTKATQDGLMKDGAAAGAIIRTGTDAMAKTSKAGLELVNTNAETLKKSGDDAFAAIQDLAQAYQSLASKNAATLSAAIQSLAVVKTPNEFMELQRKLMTEGVQSAMSDFSHIGKMTAAVYTAAFAPLRKHAETFQIGKL